MDRVPDSDASKPLPDHMKKATILEDVVALLHDDDSQVVVQKRVKLPSLKHPKRKREIDVLITGFLADYPVRIAIECKNYRDKIGVGKIDEFAGKLEDVGIPVRHGIYITSSDFTADALERAEDLGMRVLRLEGLTSDLLAAEIYEASQSVIFLMAELTGLEFTGFPKDGPIPESELIDLWDSEGREVGKVFDLVWAKWRDGQIPLTIGTHQVEMEVPSGWQWQIHGRPALLGLQASVTVSAIITTQFGKAEHYLLRDVRTAAVERGSARLMFELDDQGRVSMTPNHFRTEEELAAYIAGLPQISSILKDRIPLPRIVVRGQHYWPLSQKTTLRLLRMAAILAQTGMPMAGAMSTLSFHGMEGDDLLSVWDEIAEDHPAVRDPEWPWSNERAQAKSSSPLAPGDTTESPESKVRTGL